MTTEVHDMTGTRTRRTTRGGHPAPCHCGQCRKAEAQYAAMRYKLRACGLWHPWTDAAPVRVHVQTLMAAGVSAARVAELAGIPYGPVAHLLWGSPKRGLPPSQRIRTQTGRALLAVRPGPAALAPGAQVDATGSRRRLQALMACGWSCAAMATQMGISSDVVVKTASGSRKTVRASTARAVRVLYDRLWDRPPPGGTWTERRSASQARARAAAAGWPPPAAWDDDQIDDPAAPVPGGWQRGSYWRAEELVAEVADLARIAGCDRRQAAERLTATVRHTTTDTIEGAVTRARQRARTTQNGEAA